MGLENRNASHNGMLKSVIDDVSVHLDTVPALGGQMDGQNW